MTAACGVRPDYGQLAARARRRRHRRGELHADRAFADLGLLSARAARDRDGDLRGRRDRRHDVRKPARRLSRRRVGWRTTFLVVGLPGIAAALVFHLSVREPPRVARVRRAAALRARDAARALRDPPPTASSSLRPRCTASRATARGAGHRASCGACTSSTRLEVGLVLALNAGVSVFGQIGASGAARIASRAAIRASMWVPASRRWPRCPFWSVHALAEHPGRDRLPDPAGGPIVNAWTGPTYATGAEPRARADARDGLRDPAIRAEHGRHRPRPARGRRAERLRSRRVSAPRRSATAS